MIDNYSFKLVFVSDINIGKSEILKYKNDNKEYQNSINLNISIEKYNIKLLITELSSLERLKVLNQMYYRGSDGAFILFDITNRSSFNNLNQYINEIEKYCKDSCKVIIVIGTKSDLIQNRQVSYDEAVQFTQSKQIQFNNINFKYYETSIYNECGLNNIDNSLNYATQSLLNYKLNNNNNNK